MNNKSMNNEQQNTYGQMTGHSVGIVMKEMVRRTMLLIREKRFEYNAKEKANEYKSGQDFVTDIDYAAQRLYIKLIVENFPGVDIVAEEDMPELPEETGSELFFTIDPLDGTKAFIRQQSDGVGSLLSLVKGEEIIAAFVGDINTQELYYYRPDSDKVHRINYVDEVRSYLNDVPIKQLSENSLLLTDNQDRFQPEWSQSIFKSIEHGGLFKSVQIHSGSIGTNAARLWKGEVGALLLKSSTQQPWDIFPVIGISQKLGYVFGTVEKNKFEPVPMPISRDPIVNDDLVMIIHKDSIPQLNNWLSSNS